MAATRTDLGGIPVAGWLAAAAVVASLHVGAVALGLAQWPAEEDASAGTAGAIPVDFVPATSAPIDTPNAAPGPAQQEAPNTPEAAKRVEETPPENIEVERAPLAPQPEVVLPDAKPQNDKVEEKPPEEEKASRESPTDASVGDIETRAPPKIEAPVANTTVATVLGTDLRAQQQEATWKRQFLDHLDRHKRYPQEALARGQRGVVQVQFTIDRSGHIRDLHLTESSGSKSLDEEAIAVFRRASPLPAPPASMPDQQLSFVLPIRFNVK